MDISPLFRFSNETSSNESFEKGSLMDVDPQSIKKWGEFFVWVFGLFTVIGGFVAFCWKRLNSILRAAMYADLIFQRHGNNALEKFEQLFSELRRDVSEAQIITHLTTTHLGMCVYVCDNERNLIWANEPMCELFGLDSTEMLNTGWTSAIHPDDREGIWDRWSYSITHRLPFNAACRIINQRTNNEVKVKMFAKRREVDGIIRYIGCIAKDNERG